MEETYGDGGYDYELETAKRAGIAAENAAVEATTAEGLRDRLQAETEVSSRDSWPTLSRRVEEAFSFQGVFKLDRFGSSFCPLMCERSSDVRSSPTFISLQQRTA